MPCCSVKCIRREYQSNTATTKRELNFNGGHKKKHFKSACIVSISLGSPLFYFPIKTQVSFRFSFIVQCHFVSSNRPQAFSLIQLHVISAVTMSLGSANENRGFPAGLPLNNRRGHSCVFMSSRSRCDAA